jgi:hypothetical protein
MSLALDIVARAVFPAKILARPGQRRHLARWVASLAPGHLLRRGLPWLVYDAIDHLDAIDMRGWRVFEYGSGGSTRYWLRRAASVISVEHDPAWHARVRAAIAGPAPLDYRLAPPEPDPAPGADRDPADPAACVSGSYPRDRLRYTRYVAQIDGCADGSLDLVLVDGRARPACLARAAPKLRRGGLLVLDNSDRPYYTARLGDALAGFRPLVFRGVLPCIPVFSETTVYVRI